MEIITYTCPSLAKSNNPFVLAKKMWINTSPTSKAWVTWRPANTQLHYAALYCALWEFLRMPPQKEKEARATTYLQTLQEYPGPQLQRDRIQWVEAWLAALPGEERRRKVLGEEKYALLCWVCYEPPEISWNGESRAG